MPEPTTVAAAFVQTLAPDQYQAYEDRIAEREAAIIAACDAADARTAAMPQAPAPAPAAPADVTVFELRTGPDDDARPEVIARYATEQAAAAHGESLYRAALGTAATLEWHPTGTDTAPRYRLVAVDDLDGDEVETDWHIVPVTVPATYTPAGGEAA